MMEAGSSRWLSSRNNRLADRFRVHGLGEDLEREQIVIAVHDQAGKKVGFAEDHAIGIGVAHHPLAITDRGLDALAQEAVKVIHRRGMKSCGWRSGRSCYKELFPEIFRARR